jgi:D-alanyl-D-alanine carboxypeptidase
MTIAAALAAAVPGTAVATPAPDPLQQLADTAVQNGVAGLLVRVTDHGHVRTVRAGTTELGTSTPVPADGRYRIGSISKTFLATVVMQLVGEGKVDLDASVDRYLPGVLPDNRITVREILQHTSGLHDYSDDVPTTGAEYLKIRFKHWSEPQLVAEAVARPANFPPGTSWRYSNTDYLVAGMLVRAVTGHSWSQEEARRIFQPLGLRDTFAPGDTPFVGGGPHAHAYLVVDGRPVDVTDLNPTIAGAAGSLVSTPADLDRFITALFDGRLVKPAQLAEMTHTLPFTQGFGLGVESSATSCGRTTWGHGGYIQGFTGEVTSTLDGTRRLEVYATPVASNDTAVNALFALIDKSFCP